MRKRLYKSVVPKSLSVALLSVSLFNSSVLAVHATELSEDNGVVQEIIETDLISIEEKSIINEVEPVEGILFEDESEVDPDSKEQLLEKTTEDTLDGSTHNETDEVDESKNVDELDEAEDLEAVVDDSLVIEETETQMSTFARSSTTYVNTVSISDSSTGKTIISFTSTEPEVTNTLVEAKLAELNTLHGVEYQLDSITLVSSGMNQSSINGNTMTKYTREYNANATNTSSNKIDETNNPLYPSGTLYDDSSNERAHRTVTIKDIYGAQLYSNVVISHETVDQTIVAALDSLEAKYPNTYYYQSVGVNPGFIVIVGGSTSFRGTSYDIDITVKKYPVTEVKEEKVEKSVPFTTDYVENENLLVGQEEVVQTGENGVLTIAYKVTYVDEVEESREVTSEIETKKPIVRIIARGVKEIKQEQVKSVVNFKTQKVDNSELLLGTEEVSQKGVTGELTTTYEVIYIRGEETSRTEISDLVTKESITEIVQVGTREVKKEVVNESIPFDVEYIENSELLVGESNEITAGVAGEQAVTYEVTYVKGKEDSRKAVSYETLKESVTRVVEVGSKEVKVESIENDIPFEIEYIESEKLLVGEENIKQDGQKGTETTTFEISYVKGKEVSRKELSTKVTTKPVTKIIEKGIREVKSEVKKEVVPFETKTVDNPELLVGEELVSQTGVVGELTTTYEVTYIRGEETHRSNVSEVVTKEPITEIIQVGTKEIKQEVVNEAVPFDTEYIENSELLVGESNEITAGVAGEQDVTYEVTYIKGKVDSRKAVSYEMLKESVTRVVEVGSKEVKVESIEDDIPFEIEYIESEELLVGKENIKQDGQKGTETTTFEVTYVNGKEVSRKELSTEVTTKPVTQIIEKGIREVRAEVKTEVVPFETETVDNPELLVGEELVSQAGVDGQRTITENVYFVKGIEVDREIASNDVTLAPVNKIIQVGVKEVKTVEVNEVVEFDIEYLDNKEWLVGVEEVITPGAKGEVLVTYEITYVSGEEVSSTELSRVVLVAPTTQVVERGTIEPVKPVKPVETVKDTTTDATNSGQQTLPDTGEEKQYAIFSVAVVSILVGLGMIVPRRKED